MGKLSEMTPDETLRLLVSRLRAVSHHDLEQLRVPDSPAARAAEELSRGASAPALLNHGFRSYAWGALLGVAEGMSFDAELFYVAALLHDIGLTPAYDHGGCFESDGADAARDLLNGLGWGPDRSERVGRAIYLHMHEVADDEPAEAHLLAWGTSVDVSGTRLTDIDEPARDTVLETYPRLGFKRHFLELFTDQAARKPHCVVHAYLYEQGGVERILGAPFDD
jgi:hypothetical protein